MSPKPLIEALEESQLLEGIPRRHIRRIAKEVEVREVSKGETIIREGTFTREFFFVLDGTAKVTVRGRNRDTISRGGFFGEVALLGHSSRSATITASTSMRLGVVGAREFQEILETEPKFAIHLVQALARRLERLTQMPAGQLR